MMRLMCALELVWRIPSVDIEGDILAIAWGIHQRHGITFGMSTFEHFDAISDWNEFMLISSYMPMSLFETRNLAIPYQDGCIFWTAISLSLAGDMAFSVWAQPRDMSRVLYWFYYNCVNVGKLLNIFQAVISYLKQVHINSFYYVLLSINKIPFN